MPSESTDYRIRLSQPQNTPEIEGAVLRVLRSGRWAFGPEAEAFEREFAAHVGAKYAVAVSSGTAALEFLGWFAAMGGHKDQLTFPAMTFRATWNGVARGAGIPRAALCVVDGPVVGGASVSSVDAWLFGVPRSTRGVRPIIADLCEFPAPGAHRRANPVVGSAFGFYPNKVIAAGEGGMICTDRQDVLDMARDWRNHGRAGIAECGTNARMTEIAAAIGREELRTFSARRARLAELSLLYEEWLPRSLAVVSAPGSFSLVAATSSADAAAGRLRDVRIECSTEYFPCWCVVSSSKPCRWPIAHAHAIGHIALPMHAGLRAVDVRDVCHHVAENETSPDRSGDVAGA